MVFFVVDDGSFGFFCGRRRGGRGIVVVMFVYFGFGIGRFDVYVFYVVCYSFDFRGSFW